ncbi:MAG: phosphate ABC transporter ATP-binding protein [Bacteroidales bacterium]|nr:phosphate ABC transporter ATP-binding protein [Bacteroidales bacterium]
MQTEISIKNLNLYISKQHILKNINVEIPKNKITVIIGPSGCGKTTLLKCLNRLVDLYDNIDITGNIIMDGEDILHSTTEITKLRQKMGLLSQRPYPLPMSIYENIAYGLKINGVKNKKELIYNVEKQLKLVNLWDEVKERLNEPASRLSIGQQQRLCLARGLAVQPEIILADEPTSALDPISSQTIEEEFALLKKDYTIIMVTHILRQARRIADYIIFMYLGEVIEQGEAEQIFNNPQQQKTKNYLKGLFN